MQDFDTERVKRLEGERTFKIGGETFVRRHSVAPEAVLRWSQMCNGEFGDELKEAEAIEIFDETILALIEDGQEEKWGRVRAVDAELPITLGDMQKLVRWLFAEQADRPTGPSSDSTDGSGKDGTGTSLTVVSSPPAEVASTA